MKDPNNKHQLVVDENVRDNVKMIFSLYKDGLSIQKIANRLNEIGVLSPLEYKQSIGLNYDTVFKTSEVAKWDYKAIQRVLTNEVYIGVLAQGKQGTPNYKVKVMKQKDESEWIKVENAHEPIISYEDFHNIKEMMKRDVRSLSSTDDGSENVLSGFLFCGDCGATMIRKTIPSKNKKYIYQVCGNNKNTKACSSHSIATAKLEDIVLGAIHRQIAIVGEIEKALELIDELPYKQEKSFNYEKQIALIEDEIEKYKKIKVRLYEDLTDETISSSDYKEFKLLYTAKIEEKEKAIVRLKKEAGRVVDLYEETKSWVMIFKKYENIEQLSRRVLMSLVHAVKIYENHKVEVVFKYNDEYQRIQNYFLEIAEQLKCAENQ
ncbi:MAG: recombinase family protein [Bacillota bacterium]